MVMRNVINYRKQAYEKKGLFVYLGTTALKKGFGMCFDMDYYTSTTKETATDPFGARGLKVIEVPSASNSNRFAGVLTQSYPARTSGLQLVELALPGGCAMIAQRVISTMGLGRVTCVVDSTAGNGNSGIFTWGGLPGKGSALPLQTLAAATSGKLALSNDEGTAASVYASGTGLTTITLSGAGTAMGYTSAAVDASDYECTVLEGATASEGTTRANLGVYPVVQATGAGTFTVLGDTGDGDLTITLTKKNLLMLAFLEDEGESGLADFVCGVNGAARQFVLNQGGTTFICMGGITLSGDCTVNTLADPITIGGSHGAVKKAFNVLSSSGGSDYIVTVTSGMLADKDSPAQLSTIVLDTAKDEVVLEWNGNMGVSDVGYWKDVMYKGTTFTT